MLSRVADSLYWMSRYLERAEHTTRLLDVNLNLMLDESAASAERRWERVLLALGNPKDVEWTGDPYALTYELTFDTTHPGSILSCIIAARENSRHVREQISTEMWHRLNSLYLEVTRPGIQSDMRAEALNFNAERQPEFLQKVMEAVHQFQGVTDSTMSHGEGWQFLQIGRFLERASATAKLLDIYHRDVFSQADESVDAYEYLEWIGLLRTCTAFEAYCKVYTADLTYERIIEFLLLDPEFPHSIRYSIDRLHQSLDAIQSEGRGLHAAELMRVSGKLKASLAYAQIAEILTQDPGRYMRRILEECRLIHNLIYEVYIQYSVQTALAM